MSTEQSSPTVVRFGPFEVDCANAEIRKSGLRLRIQDQPFQVLAALLERPGEIVSREDLVARLWPDGTFVDFDRGLNAAVARLRQVLQDSAETPRYIETVARRGYRFIAPSEVVRHPGGDAAVTTASEPPRQSTTHPRRPALNRRWLVVAAGVILLAGIVSVFAFRENREPVLEQITRDRGLATDPAISPDGKLLVYASDRDGNNLDLWVKQLTAGGTARRLTNDVSDSHQPSFSPDGSRIVYRSEHDKGGVYAIPAIGGDPVLLAPGGRHPRFSPDGKWIAYWVGVPTGSSPQADGAGSVFVAPASGGAPKPVAPDVPYPGYPIWSPDSNFLLVYSHPPGGIARAEADWWLAPLDGGAARKTGAFNALRAQGFTTSFGSSIPRAWVWQDDALIFTAQKGDTRSIWKARFTPGAQITGHVDRITQGTTLDVQPSASETGLLAFASVSQNAAIWSIPIDSDARHVTGTLKRLTEGDTSESTPSISADGRMLFYGSTIPHREDIWMKDLQTGRTTALASTAAGEWHPIVSRDGKWVAYTVDEQNANGVYLVRASGGPAKRIATALCWIFDFTPDGRSLLFHEKSMDPYLRKVDAGTGVVSVYLAKEGAMLFQSKFSPDGTWLALEAVTQSPAIDSQLYILKLQNGAPEKNGEWILIGDEHGWSDKPRWSPDGNTLYFISDRDGFRCVWAQALEPNTKRPLGEPVAIYHFHSSRLSPMNTPLGLLELDVAKDKIVINIGEVTGNIWALRH